MFESFRNVVKEIRKMILQTSWSNSCVLILKNLIWLCLEDVGSCINTIGLEILTIFRATFAVVFLIVNEPYDAKLLKYCSFGGGKVQPGCPAREVMKNFIHGHFYWQLTSNPGFSITSKKNSLNKRNILQDGQPFIKNASEQTMWMNWRHFVGPTLLSTPLEAVSSST